MFLRVRGIGIAGDPGGVPMRTAHAPDVDPKVCAPHVKVVNPPTRPLLEAMLLSVAGDLDTLRTVDLTLEGATDPSSPADLVICELDDLDRALAIGSSDGLVLARAPRGDRRATLMAEARGMTTTASVRDRNDQWHLLARMKPASPGSLDASIVVTCRDQARSLLRLLTVLAVDEGPYDWELVVVDRGSFDQTGPLLRAIEGDIQVTSVSRDTPYGIALERGFRLAEAPVLVHLDLDFVPAASFVHAAIDAAIAAPDIAAFAGPLLDGPTGRVLNPEATARALVAAPSASLFALRAEAWRKAGPLPASPDGFEAYLGRCGPAALVPMFRARRPG